MDPIKQAFDKIKDDILSLKQEISGLKQQIIDLKQDLNSKKTENTTNTQTNQQSGSPTNPTHNPTQDNPLTSTPTHNPTIQQSPQVLEEQNIAFSTGNWGVPTVNPTNKPTIQQTVQHIENENKSPSYSVLNEFERAREALDSLDNIKKEIRLKFKRLTPQEMQVFSMIYSLKDQDIDEITYKILAKSLKLTESSIRDYTNRLIAKGIPVLKIRQNNKKITLDIAQDLQKIASLSTILKLRDI